MKRRIAIAVFLVIAAALLGRLTGGPRGAAGAGAPGAARDETRESFGLGRGARVEVSGINGSVEVSAPDAETAEVRVVRTAGDSAALEESRVVVEQTPEGLVVRGEGGPGRGWWRRLWGGSAVRQQVVLSLPRGVEFSARRINGPLSVGALDGGVEVAGVNGRVELAGPAGRAEIARVNGSVSIDAPRLAAEGLDVAGVNGSVVVRLGEAANADVEVNGLNGSFSLDVPNVTMRERESRSSMRARIGAGGAPVEIKGVNGRVRFEPAQ